MSLLRPYVLYILIGSLLSFGIGYFSPRLLSNTNTTFDQNTTDTSVTLTPTAKWVPPPTPKLFETFESGELLGFPIYPGSTFKEKEVYEKCDTVIQDAAFYCDVKIFNWTTPDDYNMVHDYYAIKENIANSGWACNGGGGEYEGPRSASTGFFCTKGDLFANWILDTYPSELNTTNLTLRIFQNGVNVFDRN